MCVRGFVVIFVDLCHSNFIVEFQNDKEVWKTLQALCNSETEELAKAAQGACFVINEGQDRGKCWTIVLYQEAYIVLFKR